MVRLSTNPDEADRARRDEIRLRELDRTNRRALDALGDTNIAVRHTWQGSGNIAPNIADGSLTASGHWALVEDGGIARFQPVTDFDTPGFILGRAGRWVITLIVYSDCTNSGVMRVAMAQDPALGGTVIAGVNELRDSRYRGAGFPEAGRLDQVLSVTVPVFDAAAFNPIRVWVRHNSAGAALAPASWWFQASYLGAITVPAETVIPPVDNVPQDDAAAGTTSSG